MFRFFRKSQKRVSIAFIVLSLIFNSSFAFAKSNLKNSGYVSHSRLKSFMENWKTWGHLTSFMKKQADATDLKLWIELEKQMSSQKLPTLTVRDNKIFTSDLQSPLVIEDDQRLIFSYNGKRWQMDLRKNWTENFQAMQKAGFEDNKKTSIFPWPWIDSAQAQTNTGILEGVEFLKTVEFAKKYSWVILSGVVTATASGAFILCASELTQTCKILAVTALVGLLSFSTSATVISDNIKLSCPNENSSRKIIISGEDQNGSKVSMNMSLEADQTLLVSKANGKERDRAFIDSKGKVSGGNSPHGSAESLLDYTKIIKMVCENKALRDGVHFVLNKFSTSENIKLSTSPLANGAR